ncbi:MAG: HIT family protein [Aggregatilineales bacterium]
MSFLRIQFFWGDTSLDNEIGPDIEYQCRHSVSFKEVKMANECLICTRISQIKTHTNPFFVAELATGYVVLGDFQFFRGYTLFLCNQHIPELHQLEPGFKLRFLEEMSGVAQAVFDYFKPMKLNYELLGNSEPHLHWHFFPRHQDDPMPRSPVWLVDKSIGQKLSQNRDCQV